MLLGTKTGGDAGMDGFSCLRFLVARGLDRDGGVHLWESALSASSAIHSRISHRMGVEVALHTWSLKAGSQLFHSLWRSFMSSSAFHAVYCSSQAAGHSLSRVYFLFHWLCEA